MDFLHFISVDRDLASFLVVDAIDLFGSPVEPARDDLPRLGQDGNLLIAQLDRGTGLEDVLDQIFAGVFVRDTIEIWTALLDARNPMAMGATSFSCARK